MFNRYFQQELTYLKELAAEFARAHPALAPMLSGAGQDPDVERLFEGVAFTAGLLRQKLEDDFPEIIHGLMDLVFPHYLRPSPSTSIVAFTPKPGLKETVRVSKGTEVASLPVEGTACLFRTAFDFHVHPLRLTGARIVEQPGRALLIRLNLELTGMTLESWNPAGLRFFLGGTYADATNLFMLLSRHLKSITLRSQRQGREFRLPPEMLQPSGFAADEALLPYPAQSFPAYRLIQEYFILPQKFLFMTLEGLERWSDRGDGSDFEIDFELFDPPFHPSRVKPDNFVLFACPVINIFDHTAVPINLDHRRTEYPVRPSGDNPAHYQVYSVDEVTGILRGSVVRRSYAPFDRFRTSAQDQPVFRVLRRLSPVDNSARIYLSLPYAEKTGAPLEETLSLRLSCTNGTLPENLQLGDISRPTSSSPELLEFENITPTTAPFQPPLGQNTLWRFLSHLSLNYLPLADAGSLKELLRLYVFPEGRDKAKIAANLKRIDGIETVRVSPADRLVSGYMLRGQDIRIDFRQDCFAGPGDLYLLGAILNHFFGAYAAMNTFTRLHVRDTLTGETYRWQTRIGDTPLL